MNAGPILADETAAQEQRFTRAFELIRHGIAEHVFPGAALAVAHHGRLLACEGFGRFTYDAASPQVCRDTVWDLASLTKPIATASMAMILLERGKLKVHAPVVEYLPEFAGVDLRDAPLDAAVIVEDELQREWRHLVTVAMLLAHSSGLPVHRRLYLELPGVPSAPVVGVLGWKGRKAMLDAARSLRLEAQPGTRAEYSDMGYIVLGELLERVAGERIDDFCRREIFESLKLKMSFTPDASDRQAIPPTVDDRVYRHRVVQGEVNDENASAMGGVAGHAGLFGDALSVARFAELILRGGKLPWGKLSDAVPLFRPETVALFTARQAEPPGTSRTLGWDTPSPPSQSGTMFSRSSFGHLGYTGTSLWCDPERQLSVTLLTNRTWPDSKNQAIKALRPKVHDAIVESLEE